MDSRFVDYIADPRPMEERLAETMQELAIKPEDVEAIQAFLAPLRCKGPVYYFQYQHSVRVMLLAVAVAKFMHLDRRAMFYSGILHDVGKVQVPLATLGKVSGWTDHDRALVQRHVMDGYRMVAGRFDFSAEILYTHHQFQTAGYPKTNPAPLHPYCKGTEVSIGFMGRMLALCDVFDALHRINDKHGEPRAPTGEEIRRRMYEYNRDQWSLLNELFDAGIFTVFTKPAVITVP